MVALRTVTGGAGVSEGLTVSDRDDGSELKPDQTAQDGPGRVVRLQDYETCQPDRVLREMRDYWNSIRKGENERWAYPAVTWVGDRALVTYFNYTGGLALQLRNLPAAWFYE